MQSYPAVLIGGPPHSGKSVLLYALSQALRSSNNVQHYAMRSCPDGEGDWSQEAAPDTVRAIRIKGGWTSEWVERIYRDIRSRHLPLLVDVGGRPTLDQERIFDQCTHAILLSKDDSSHREWSDRVARHGLPVLADLRSQQEGASAIADAGPPLRGVVTGLERNRQIANDVIDALVALLTQLFAADQDDLRRRHLGMAPDDIEMVVDLDRLAATLGWAQPKEKVIWRPEYLPLLLDYLPAATPLAVYGRGTNWIQTALARLAYPEPYFSFDVRLAWVQALALKTGAPRQNSPMSFARISGDGWQLVKGILPPSQYVDFSELPDVIAPVVAPGMGVILSGKLPYWLYTSLAFTYADAPWLAVFQPQLHGAVVVHSRVQDVRLGEVLAMERREGEESG